MDRISPPSPSVPSPPQSPHSPHSPQSPATAAAVAAAYFEPLPLFLNGVRVAISNELSAQLTRTLRRIAVAYGGSVVPIEWLNPDRPAETATPTHVVLWEADAVVDQALEALASAEQVSPAWLIECHNHQCRVAEDLHRPSHYQPP